MEIKITSDKNNIKILGKLEGDFDTGVLQGVRNAMFFTESISKKSFGKSGNLNVLSGRLRSSIRVKVEKLRNEVRGTIGSDVIYGAVHEFGNFRTIARPFIQPSIDENVEKIGDIIMKSVDKEVK